MIVYCASGYRSQVAASVLLDAGFADVSDLLGGFTAWDGAGLPTSTGATTEDVGTTPQVGARAGEGAGRRRRAAPRRARTRRVAGRARTRRRC